MSVLVDLDRKALRIALKAMTPRERAHVIETGRKWQGIAAVAARIDKQPRAEARKGGKT
jgi:hypothetical protein